MRYWTTNEAREHLSREFERPISANAFRQTIKRARRRGVRPEAPNKYWVTVTMPRWDPDVLREIYKGTRMRVTGSKKPVTQKKDPGRPRSHVWQHAQAITEAYRNGDTYRELAHRYQVAENTIAAVIKASR